MTHEKLILATILMLTSASLWSQIQSGYVKSLGRPERVGEPLAGVSVRASGGHNSALSDSSGCFFLTLAGKQNGDSYSIQQVFKSGYELNDYEVIGRPLAFSDKVPLNIVMVSSAQLQEDKQRIISNAYKIAEENYKDRAAELEKQNNENIISAESYRKRLQELQSGFGKYQTLIESLADRYAHTDYDMLDEAEREINRCIEAGDLARADSLIRTVFNPVEVLERNMDALSRLDGQILQAGQMLADAESEMAELLKRQAKDAEYLYRLYTIALLRFETDDAAKYLMTRAELDTTNVEWQNEAGVFISEYMADYDKAMMLYRRALRNAINKYGENHPDVGITIGNIACVYSHQGNYDKALECFNYALDSFYDQKHSNIPIIYNNIGIIYADKGEYGKALEYYTKALQIKTELFGKNHLDVDIATSYNNIGHVYCFLNYSDKALEYYNFALEILTEFFGENYPDVATLYNNIGYIYFIQGDCEKALGYYSHALKIRTGLFGEKHPDVAVSYNNIGDIYSDKEDYKTALEYHAMALDIRTGLFGEKHPDVAVSYNNIGYIYSATNDYDRALECYERALLIQTELFGEKHQKVATLFNNIGGIYAKSGDYDKALEYFNRALTIRVDLFGKNHRETAISYTNIGAIYYTSGDYKKALKYLNMALSIQTELFGENSPNIASTYNNIGYIYYNKGDYAKALQCFRKALKIREKFYPEGHPAIKAVKENTEYIETLINESE